MTNGKFLITLVSIVVILFAILNTGSSTQENFWGGIDLRARPIRVGMTNQGEVALPSSSNQVANLAAPNDVAKGMFYQVPGTWQSQLSPRAGLPQGGVGAYIRYNPPSQGNMAFNGKDPLTLGKMVENYASCGAGGVGGIQVNPPQATPPGYASTNYNKVMSELESGTDSLTTSQLPVTGMDMLGADGDIQAPIVYDRFIYSNSKSRLYGLADHIRGDLPIAPSPSGWFRPSVNPQVDLNPGALAVMAGLSNDSARATYDLIHKASGGTLNTMAGVNIAEVNPTVQQEVSLSAFNNDVSVSAFP